MCSLILFTAFQPVSVFAAVEPEVPVVKVKNTNKGIKISWSKSENARKYIVLRKLSNGKKFKTVKTFFGETTKTYTDETVKAGKSYSYKVQAIKGKKTTDSKVRKIVRLTTPTVYDRTEGAGCIYLSAENKSLGAKEFQVYRAKVKNKKIGKYKLVGTFDATDPWAGYRDKKTEKGVFNFKIRAVNGKSKSAFSPVVRVDFFKPLEVNARLREDNNGIDITWVEINSVDGFRIYRSADGSEPELIKDLPLEDCELYLKTKRVYPEYFYTDRKVKDFVTYEYYVEAYTGKKSNSMEKAFDSVTYQSADYFVKVGGTSQQAAQDIADARKLLEEMGMDTDYTVTLSSNAEHILQVDENNNLIGKGYGRAELKKTVTMKVDGKEIVNVEYLTVKVLNKF